MKRPSRVREGIGDRERRKKDRGRKGERRLKRKDRLKERQRNYEIGGGERRDN